MRRFDSSPGAGSQDRREKGTIVNDNSKTKTTDDWDELTEALSRALPNGVEVAFPGKDDDEDYDLRLIPGDDGFARLVIDLGDADTAHSEETIHLEWGLNQNEDEYVPDLQWWARDWSRSGAEDTDSPQEMAEAMSELAGDVIGTALDMIQVLAGGEREDGAIHYNDQGSVEIDDNLRSVLVDAYDKGAMDVRQFIRETIVDNIDLQPEEGFADVHQDPDSDWIFVNERSGRALNLDVDLRYPADGGSRCMVTRIGAQNSDTIFIKRAAEAMMSEEDSEKMHAAIDWLIDEDAEKKKKEEN